MSLKRLLNPEDTTDEHVGSRPIWGWDDHGAPIQYVLYQAFRRPS